MTAIRIAKPGDGIAARLREPIVSAVFGPATGEMAMKTAEIG